MAATAGDARAAHSALGHAERLLAQATDDSEVPYLMLDDAHLARWRGACLARLGEAEAIDFLTSALDRADDSVRAATGLHADLAIALNAAGRNAEAQEHAARALYLADQSGSERQRARLRRLVVSAER